MLRLPIALERILQVVKLRRQRGDLCDLRACAVDHDNDDYAVWESNAILMYLAEKAGNRFYPVLFSLRSEVHQWLFFQSAGIGPMQGQLSHFTRYASEHIEYAVQRYAGETTRLYGVLDKWLSTNKWLAAGQYTMAGVRESLQCARCTLPVWAWQAGRLRAHCCT
jgi:glutathione S-transferase